MGQTMFEVMLKTLNNQAGATAIEYGLIGALVSVAAVGALTAIGDSLHTLFMLVSTQLASAASAATSP